ncbi:hypothetical protein [Pseudomonas sp. P5_C3]
MAENFYKIDLQYLNLGLVITDNFGIPCAEVYILYATIKKTVIAYSLLNSRPNRQSTNLLKIHIRENLKVLDTWMENPIGYSHFFRCSPWDPYQPKQMVIDHKKYSALKINLSIGSDYFLDALLDIPPEYLSPLLSPWKFSPNQAMRLVQNQIKQYNLSISTKAEEPLFSICRSDDAPTTMSNQPLIDSDVKV